MNHINKKKKKVAILFFGLTRSLTKIYDNLKTNIFDVLTNNDFEYDIFIHTYVLSNPYINPWSGENVYNYDNNAYKILNPKYYILENQDATEKKLNIPRYYAKLGNWNGAANDTKMKCYLVRNMVLALHSKKCVTNLFSKYQHEYDYAIITRPDQLLNTPLNINSFKILDDNNIIIPQEYSYSGINDRFCISKPKNAIIYGLALNKLLHYSEKKSIISELYLKDYLTFYKIKILFSPLKASLVRC
jgi:hypothetical protein